MRPLLVFAILFALPGLYLLFNDYTKYQQNPEGGFHISTIGEVWLDHDHPGFMEFKSGYKGDEMTWDQDIRPKLDWQALPIVALPAILFYFWVFVCWLLGRGPFTDWGATIIRSKSEDTSNFARSNAKDRGSRISYRRK